MRNVGNLVLDHVLVVEYLRLELGLDEEVAGGQEPREGEQVDGHRVEEELECEGDPFRGEILKRISVRRGFKVGVKAGPDSPRRLGCFACCPSLRIHRIGTLPE
jgi:hypothetical protein